MPTPMAEAKAMKNTKQNLPINVQDENIILAKKNLEPNISLAFSGSKFVCLVFRWVPKKASP